MTVESSGASNRQDALDFPRRNARSPLVLVVRSRGRHRSAAPFRRRNTRVACRAQRTLRPGALNSGPHRYTLRSSVQFSVAIDNKRQPSTSPTLSALTSFDVLGLGNSRPPPPPAPLPPPRRRSQPLNPRRPTHLPLVVAVSPNPRRSALPRRCQGATVPTSTPERHFSVRLVFALLLWIPECDNPNRGHRGSLVPLPHPAPNTLEPGKTVKQSLPKTAERALTTPNYPP